MAWVKDTPMPAPINAATAFSHGANVYVLGGYENDNFVMVAAVRKAHVQPGASLGPWKIAGHVPEGLYLPAVAVARDHLFVVGGLDSSFAYSDRVYSANFDGNGDLGAFKTLDRFPGGTIATLGAAATDSHLYLVAGFNGTARVANVWIARIGPGGTIANWRQGPPYPEALSFLQAFVFSNYLYGVGGSSGASSAVSRSYVYRSRIEPDGSLGNWVRVGELPYGIQRHGLALVGNRVFITAGIPADGGTRDRVSCAQIFADGSLGNFQALSRVPVPVETPALASAHGVLYQIGGVNNGGASLPDTYRLIE